MTCHPEIVLALKSLERCKVHEDGYLIDTQLLYPSRACVRLFVRFDRNAYFICDNAHAFLELQLNNIDTARINGLCQKIAKRYGIKSENGRLYLISNKEEDLGADIIMLANASKDLATIGQYVLGTKKTRDFRPMLESFLRLNYPNEIRKNVEILGESNRQYRFDYELHGEKRDILINAVSNDAASINKAVVSSVDIRISVKPKLPISVYDANTRWDSANLALLKRYVRSIPYQSLATELPQLAA